MNPRTLKLLQQIASHLEDSQGGELKSLLDAKKSPLTDPLKPKALSIEKVEIGKAKDPTKPEFDQKVDEAIDEST